jgi:hypothetical protein
MESLKATINANNWLKRLLLAMVGWKQEMLEL